MSEAKLTVDLEKNDRENQVDTSASKNPCFTYTQSLIQRINQSITSKENINLVYMTFNDETFEKEFQLSIEERLLLMTKILGIIVAATQSLIIALLYVGSAAIDGIIVARLLLIVLIFVTSFLRFPNCLNLTPRRRATFLILLAYLNLTLSVLTPNKVIASASLNQSINIMVTMLTFASLSVLLVVSSTSLLIMNVASFYLLYTAIHDHAVNHDTELSENKFIFFTCFAITISVLINTIVSCLC